MVEGYLNILQKTSSLPGLDTLMNQMEDLARLTCGAYHYLNHLVLLKILYPLMDLVSHGGWSLLLSSSSKLISSFISFCGQQKVLIVVLWCSVLKEADIEWFSSWEKQRIYIEKPICYGSWKLGVMWEEVVFAFFLAFRGVFGFFMSIHKELKGFSIYL